jgi:hypothetical protein
MPVETRHNTASAAQYSDPCMLGSVAAAEDNNTPVLLDTLNGTCCIVPTLGASKLSREYRWSDHTAARRADEGIRTI